MNVSSLLILPPKTASNKATFLSPLMMGDNNDPPELFMIHSADQFDILVDLFQLIGLQLQE